MTIAKDIAKDVAKDVTMHVTMHGDRPSASMSWHVASALNQPVAAAWRFCATFFRLIRHFAHDQGLHFWWIAMAVIASGFLHSIPLVWLATLVRSAQAGQQDFHIGFGAWSVALSHDAGIVVVLAAGILAILMHFAVARLVQQRTLAWQENLFWQVTSSMPEIARWDRSFSFGVPLLPARIGNRVLAAVRSGFLIGRLLETGLRDAAIVILALALLVWLDSASVLVLVYISLLFLPVYGLALSDLVRGQVRSAGRSIRAVQALSMWLRGTLVTSNSRRIDLHRVTPGLSEAVRPSFSGGMLQIAALSGINAVAGIHLFAAFFAVFVADGGSLASLPDEKLFFFLVLLVMLRSMQGLISLISRLSRGYEGLSLLRDLLFPVTRPLPAVRDTKPAFDITHSDLAVTTLRAGDKVIFLAPQTNFAYQTLPLTDVLVPVFDWRAIGCRYIALLDLQDLAQLGQSTAKYTAVERPETASLKLPLVAVSPNCADAPIVAVLSQVWVRCQRDKAIMAYLNGRIVVIIVGPNQNEAIHANWAKSGLLTVASDGTGIIGCGDFAAMLKRAQAAVPGTGARIDEDEDLDGDAG